MRLNGRLVLSRHPILVNNLVPDGHTLVKIIYENKKLNTKLVEPYYMKGTNLSVPIPMSSPLITISSNSSVRISNLVPIEYSVVSRRAHKICFILLHF